MHQWVPGGRNTDEANIGRDVLFPAIDELLEGVAVIAAVPEDFGDFDLVGATDG